MKFFLCNGLCIVWQVLQYVPGSDIDAADEEESEYEDRSYDDANNNGVPLQMSRR